MRSHQFLPVCLVSVFGLWFPCLPQAVGFIGIYNLEFVAATTLLAFTCDKHTTNKAKSNKFGAVTIIATFVQPQAPLLTYGSRA